MKDLYGTWSKMNKLTEALSVLDNTVWRVGQGDWYICCSYSRNCEELHLLGCNEV
jgi:hypothetical protein